MNFEILPTYVPPLFRQLIIKTDTQECLGPNG